MPGKVIPSPSLSSSSSSLDVYSISCLTDLREMQMKGDPDFFLKSKDERPQPQELQQPASSRSCRRFVNHFNFEPETASHSNVSAFLSDCSCSGSCVCGDSGSAAEAARIGPETVPSGHINVVQRLSQSLVEANVTAILSDSSSTEVRGRSSVGGRKSLAAIVPVEEPVHDWTEKLSTTHGLASKVSIQSLKNDSQFSEKTVKFPEVVLSVQDDCESLRLKSPKIDEFNAFDSKQIQISLENASTTNTNMFVTFASAGSDISAASAATVDDISLAPVPIAVDSRSRLCLPCAESLVTKWRRIILALTKNHRSLVRNTRISGLVTSSSALHREEQDKNSTFSFIFTTSLSASQDPVSFFDQGILQKNTEPARTMREDFDGVEDICSARTNTALASITSTFTGVLLYRQRCWHLTNYLCIGDRYCASNGQLLCQMSVAGLVILCCHENGNMETSSWSEPQQQRSKNNPGSPLRSNRLLEQTTLVTTRLNSPSGYTHPECDSDHAIPMMPCVCGAQVKPSERHNRSALRLNLTGSSLIEIQACFPEMNRFIDGFRRIGRRVMIVSASYPEQCGGGGEGAGLTVSDGVANKDSLAFSNPAFDSSNEDYNERKKGATIKRPTNKSDNSDSQQQCPLPGDTLTVLAVLQHLMLVDRMTFREARNVLLRAHYPLRLSKAVISLLESIEHSMALQRRRAARD